MSFEIKFTSNRTADFPKSKPLEINEINFGAHSVQKLNLAQRKTGRLWVVKICDENGNYYQSQLYFGTAFLSKLPGKSALDLDKEFTVRASPIRVSSFKSTSYNFIQEGENVATVESWGTLKQVNKDGYSYMTILGVVGVVALLALGATYFTGTFPFQAQRV